MRLPPAALWFGLLAVCGAATGARAAEAALAATVHRAVEWSLTSARERTDPFSEVELDALVRDEAGREWRLPAFWAGGRTWRFRFAAPAPGTYRFATVCTDPTDPGLHGRQGTIAATAGAETSPLWRHGPLRLSADRRHFAHADGTPFFWLADSWWFGMTSRLRFPAEFRTLLDDRVAKGFSVIQFAIAFPCDIAPFDPRGANEAGHAWTADFGAINPAYFDLTDQRVRAILDAGLVPNLVGAWSYYLPRMGIAKMQRHWRYLIARYGAWPVVWTLAGESTLVYYDHKAGTPAAAAAREAQVRDWAEVARYLRQTDPFHRLLTVHPGPNSGGLRPIADPSLLDFILLQPGHSDWETLPVALDHLARARRAFPDRPSLMGEVNFEGMHGGGSGPKIQRLLFWSTVLSGAPGFSYGTDTTWQFNRRDDPFGPSPNGMTWGNLPWEEGYRWAGSTHVGLGRKILASLAWWQLEPHPEWIFPAATPTDFMKPYCAGVPGRLRVVYLPKGQAPWVAPFQLRQLEPGVAYTARYVDPITGRAEPSVEVVASPAGEWPLPYPPILQDWVLILEAKSAASPPRDAPPPP
jgi:hypothetical protein